MVKAPGSSVPELPQGHSKTAKRHLSVCLTRSNAAFAFFDSELCEVCGGCGYNFKLSACEVHGHVSGGAPLQAVQEVLLGTKPEVVYIPTQNATETALLSILSSINQGSPQQDVGSAADASIYQWPAASEAGQEQAYASLAGNGIQIVPSRLFVFSRALAYITKVVTADGIKPCRTSREFLEQIKSRLGTDCHNALRAAGGLVSTLVKEGILVDKDDMIYINKLQRLKLTKLVQVSKAALRSLRIIDVERHPSLMGIGTCKEGFSISSMLDRCMTAKGKKLLQDWIEAPIADIDELTRRQDAVQSLLHDESSRTQFRSLLAQVGEPLQLIQKLAGAPTAPLLADLRKMQRSLDAMLQLAIELMQQDLAASLEEILSFLHGWFDFQEQSQIGILVPGNSELDAVKDQYSALPSLLRSVADEEISKVPAWLASIHCSNLCLSCHFSGNSGYLIFSHGREIPEALLQNVFSDYTVWSHESDFDGREGVFYRCHATDELNERIGDVEERVLTLEAQLSRVALLELHIELQAVLTPNLRWLAELDVTCAMAEVSSEKCFIRPTLTHSNILKIIKGWHPLAAAVVDSFHPNDLTMLDSVNRILVVTGANGSGKSIFLQQVGIIVHLAHIGCFVPAESAEIGLVDAIFSRTNSDVERIETFAHDLTHLGNVLQNASERSLVLMDELGKGTLPVDGASLLISCLSHFSLQAKPPKLVCVTHCLETAKQDLLPRNDQMQFGKMAAHIVAAGAQPTECALFLYQLVCPSEPSPSSFAHQCLAQAGIGNDVLSRIEAIQAAIGVGASCLPMVTPSRIYTKTASQVMTSGAGCELGDVLDTIL